MFLSFLLVVLTAGGQRVEIDPATLAVNWRVAVSSPQSGLGAVADLKTTASEASWTLGENKVRAIFTAEGLTMRFGAARPSVITWPSINASWAKAFLVPRAEGVYVPVGDKAWGNWSVDSESLSMPFIGIQGGRFTLTYLLESAFDNEVQFTPAAALVRHRFQKNWNGAEYIVHVRFGASSPVEPARQFRRWLGEVPTLKQKFAATPEAAKLAGAAHVYVWSGLSTLLPQFKGAGLDRLWLGFDGMERARRESSAIQAARDAGYLVAPYDSYDSIHAPGAKDTWETAQFDAALYSIGPVIGEDGRKQTGFAGKGFHLSSKAARPWFEKRTAGNLKEIRFNSYFLDCDASGAVYDNYSPRFAATSTDDMHERVDRMRLLIERYKTVLGSENGAWFATGIIHFAHGMMTPAFGFKDPALKDRKSPHFVGAYWPPDAPQVFFRQTTLPENYKLLYYDPRYRIPLYQTAFHSSVVTTHHWLNPTLKFTNTARTNELLEILYGVPPLYHLTVAEFAKQKQQIVDHYRVWSPLHRQIATLPMASFEFLSDDRMLQRTRFGDVLEITVDFRTGRVETKKPAPNQ